MGSFPSHIQTLLKSSWRVSLRVFIEFKLYVKKTIKNILCIYSCLTLDVRYSQLIWYSLEPLWLHVMFGICTSVPKQQYFLNSGWIRIKIPVPFKSPHIFLLYTDNFMVQRSIFMFLCHSGIYTECTLRMNDFSMPLFINVYLRFPLDQPMNMSYLDGTCFCHKPWNNSLLL